MLNIVLVIIIFYILFIFSKKKSIKNTNNKNENYKNSSYTKFYNSKYNNNYKNNYNNVEPNIIDDVVSWDDSFSNNSNIITNPIINKNFIKIKFHNDYRDVITAINNLVPEKRQFFNLANIPLNYTEPESNEVKNLVADFIKVINDNIKEQVPDKRNPNSGWDEAIVDPTVKETGWEKAQKSLGLQPSLWNKPAKNNKIKLVSIKFVQKYETEDEIKYSSDIIVQKQNVPDQMVLKVSFIQDKRNLQDENNFFLTKSIIMPIIIEQIFVTGYLSNEGFDEKIMFDKDMEKFADFDNFEYNNLTDPKFVQAMLMKKYRQRTTEMQQRNAMLDEEGQEFHKKLPHIYDYDNIKGTRTIFKDMNEKKKFY